MQGIERYGGPVRRKSFSGPITGGLQVISMGPVTLTGVVQRALKAKLPYNSRIAAIGWYARLTAVTVATLQVSTRVAPTAVGSQRLPIFAVATGAQADPDIFANPVDTIFLNDTAGIHNATSFIDNNTIHDEEFNGAGGGTNRDFTEHFIRAGTATFTGTSLELSVFVYYWPTDHAYSTANPIDDRNND